LEGAPRGVTRLAPVVLEGPAGKLEGLLHERQGHTPEVAAIVCHPHPLHGGTLHNKVVHRVAASFHDPLGAAVLRFNFRGVGGSEGKFDHGVGELEDARSALAFLRRRYPGTRLWVAGFSFGAWVAARLAASEPGIERLVLIAPPVRSSSFEVLRAASVWKLIVQGTRDEVCPLADLECEWMTWAQPRRLILIEGATHFFDRQLGALAEALVQTLGDPIKGATS